MYDVDFAKQLELSPRPYHTLAQAFAAKTGRGIDTRIVQKLLKTYKALDILSAMDAMVGKDVTKPVPYLVGILTKRNKQDMVVQVKEDKFKSAIDMAREPGEKLEIRSPFDAVTT